MKTFIALYKLLRGLGHMVKGVWWVHAHFPKLSPEQTEARVQVWSLQLLALMTTITLLPSLLLMMTSFVRIIIVMSILRQALGTGQTPPNTVLVGLSLFLTLVIMSPVLTEVHKNALLPYLQQDMKFDKALAAAEQPIRGFMMRQTREDDIASESDSANVMT